MAIRLIYHAPESMNGGVSPFDSIIMEMVPGNELQIACPYLGVSYLQRIIEQCSGWRLITDIEEWLAAHSVEWRKPIVDFILSNREQVRHCKDFHAKVLIAGTRALAGSANFTEKGITGRVEMSVLFDRCEEVLELRAWFEFLWSQTAPVIESDLHSFVASLPQPTLSADTIPLPCNFPGVAAKLLQLDSVHDSPEADAKLISRLRLAPNRQWAESWLDLAKELVEAAGLDADDPRLVMSLPQGAFLPVTINRRYVLTAFRLDESTHEKRWLIPNYANPPGQAVVELILPASMNDRIQTLSGVVRHGCYDPGFRGENADNVPQFVSFSMAANFEFSPEVMEGWQQAVLAECAHQRASNFRKFHEPVVYRATTDPDYRKYLLDRAFPATDL